MTARAVVMIVMRKAVWKTGFAACFSCCKEVVDEEVSVAEIFCSEEAVLIFCDLDCKAGLCAVIFTGLESMRHSKVIESAVRSDSVIMLSRT